MKVIKSYFTLVELLVVIAVIGILTSMLLPSLHKARQAGFKALCINNLKQIGILFVTYSDNNNTHYPIRDNTYEGQVSWDDLLGDYDGRNLTETQKQQQHFTLEEQGENFIYKCPASIQDRSPNSLKTYMINDSYVHDDISTNGAIRGVAGWANNAGWSINTSQIASSSNFIVSTETHLFNNLLGYTGAGGEAGARDYIQSYSPTKLPVHAKDVGGVEGFYIHGVQSFKLNFLYGDGHVKTNSIRSTLGDVGAANFMTGANTSWSYLDVTPWNALHND